MNMALRKPCADAADHPAITMLWASERAAPINGSFALWCAARMELQRGFQPPYVTLGVFDGGGLIAVILYNNYQPEAGVIEFHGASASSRWLNRRVLREMFSYPFDQLGCQMVVARTSGLSGPLHRILKAYGFTSTAIPRLRGRDEDEIIWTLTDDAWRSNGFH